MTNNRSAKKSIIRESFVRLLLLNIVVLMVNNVSGFVDNIVISRFLGTHALAAVGYFSPLSVVTGLAFVVILGAATLCGNLIGSGKQRGVNALFTTSFTVIAVVYIAFSLLSVFARDWLAALLGAKDEAHGLLSDYLLGFMPGVAFTALSALMMSLSSYNNEINRSYAASGALFFSNLLLDVLLVKPMGILGIGLASTLAGLLSFAILLPGFVKHQQTIHLERGAFDGGLLLQAVKRGLPSLLFTAGMLAKNSLLNHTLTTWTGYEGVAVVNLLGSLCGIAGTLAGGCNNAFSTLASLSYGEEDREGMIDAFRVASRVGIVITAALAAALAALAEPLSSFFFETGTSVWKLSKNMFILGFLFFPVNVIINLMMSSYKAQGRMTLVNVLSFAETAMIGVIALLTVPLQGSDAAWLANTWSDLLTLAILLISVWVWRGRVCFGVADLLKLPDSFGAGPDESAEYTVSSLSDVSAVSEALVAHCESRGAGRRKAFLTGLCAEEMMRNVLQHGAAGKKYYHVNVRVVCKEELILRIQDDCRRFDPRERMEMHSPGTPDRNIGLRMVAGLATNIDYYNNAGINTLIIRM